MAAYTTIDLARSPSARARDAARARSRPGRARARRRTTTSLAPTPVPARLDVSRTAAGYALRLRFAGELAGPVRALPRARRGRGRGRRPRGRPAAHRRRGAAQPLRRRGLLDVGAWAHDALALALPEQLLCRPDCAGLCPVCGESLNDAEPGAHDHPSDPPDPRFAKLPRADDDQLTAGARVSYHSAPPWPSRRSEQSRTRRDKRRATHNARQAAPERVPALPQPAAARTGSARSAAPTPGAR